MRKIKLFTYNMCFLLVVLPSTSFVSCKRIYSKENFSWDNFIDPNHDGVVENNEKSNWNYLCKWIQLGLTETQVRESIGKSKIVGDGDPKTLDFSWNELHEYFAQIPVNGLMHKVRLVGLNDDMTNNTSALMTWEFYNVISDNKGSPLKTVWHTSSSDNINYWSSTINNFLTSNILPTIWKDTPILERNIKTVIRNTNIEQDDAIWTHSSEDASQQTKLFLPTLYNLNKAPVSSPLYDHEGSFIYDFYRLHKSINDFQKTSMDGSHCLYWLASPNVILNGNIWSVSDNGELSGQWQADEIELSVAPCFCL